MDPDRDPRPFTRVIPDDLPQWAAAVDLAIGEGEDQDAVFIQPVPLGSVASGDVYVIDPPQKEVRRFGPRGEFKDVVVRPGGGPAELRLVPFAYGLVGDTLWFHDYATGRIYFIDAVHRVELRSKDTGLAAERLGGGVVRTAPLSDGTTWTELTVRSRDQRSLRPSVTRRYLRHRDGVVVTNYDVVALASSLVLDGGKTSVRYAGPPDFPVVLPILGSGILQADRSAPDSEGRSVLRLKRLNESGEVIKSRALHLPARHMSSATRDSIETAIIRGATWDGARTLDPAVRGSIEDLVTSIPTVLPSFANAASGPETSFWFELYPLKPSATHQWLVVDSALAPIAIVNTPSSVEALYYRGDGRWWCTMRDDSRGIRFVARLKIEAAVE